MDWLITLPLLAVALACAVVPLLTDI